MPAERAGDGGAGMTRALVTIYRFAVESEGRRLLIGRARVVLA